MFGQELAAEVGRRHGSPVEMMHLNRGIFDEASISVITSATVGEIGRLAAQRPDVRRFRPNILIASLRSVPFEEDEWVGGVLSFGETSEAAAIGITNRDERCSMVNFDPDSARPAAEVLKAIVRVRDNKAGVYGTVTRRGRLAVGQPILLRAGVERQRGDMEWSIRRLAEFGGPLVLGVALLRCSPAATPPPAEVKAKPALPPEPVVNHSPSDAQPGQQDRARRADPRRR